jgi:hypothetical protein
MRTSSLTAVAALCALGLAGCNDNAHRAGMGGGAGLCIPFGGPGAGAAGPPSVAAAPADPAAAVDDCLHRWGYALAASSDPADQVAQATVAACASTLSRWNQQAMPAAAAPGAPAEAPSLITGEPTTPAAERHAYVQGRALFYVVQARAGKCAAPPMTNGVPSGTATTRE